MAGSPSLFWPLFFASILSASLGASVTVLATKDKLIDAMVKTDKLEDENESLIEQKAKAESERDAAIARQKAQRNEIYASDKTAKDWASQPIPDSIRDRMRSITENYEGGGGKGK